MAAHHASTPTARTRGELPALPAAAPAELSRPASRLFVVQLAEGTGCRGQVEHVLSGRRQPFATANELLVALGLPARPAAA